MSKKSPMKPDNNHFIKTYISILIKNLKTRFLIIHLSLSINLINILMIFLSLQDILIQNIRFYYFVYMQPFICLFI